MWRYGYNKINKREEKTKRQKKGRGTKETVEREVRSTKNVSKNQKKK